MHKSRAFVVMLMFVAAASCSKSSSTADTTAASTASGPQDVSAEKAAILRSDSAWMNAVIAKNVDSLMTFYTSDAVSYGFGPAAAGVDKIRANYADFVKSKVEFPMINQQDVQFSADGTMAYDHGTYGMTVTPPGGKAAAMKGAFLNVWRKVDGHWKLVAEMSTPM